MDLEDRRIDSPVVERPSASGKAVADRATPPPARIGKAKGRAETPGAARAAWPLYLGCWVALVVAIGLMFARDVAHLSWIWWNNDTFSHCLIIPPIIAWLVWQRRDGLARMAPQPWLPGVGLLLLGGMVWLMGELAGVALFRHAALVFMLQASVPTIFGLAVTRALTFPVLFALFMIPVGEQLVPYLQTFTAQFCIKLLDLFGVPAYMDGVFISIPNGEFEVAEACSGVKFLIAMVAFGALVSNVCFKSWRRRLAFMIAAVAVPIIANGFRAWGTIYIAHRTTPDFARSVDHVVYGWFFFAFVMLLLVAIGWRFFDRPVDDPMIDPERLQRPGTQPGPVRALATAGFAAVALAAAAPVYASYIASRAPEAATAALAFDTPPGWSRTTYGGTPWLPHYAGATATRMESFVDAGGQPVELYVAVFDTQGEGHELVGYKQGVVMPGVDAVWSWAGDQKSPIGGHAFQINAPGAVREVFQYYVVNGRVVGSAYAAKLEGLKAKLLGGPPRAATVIVSAQRADQQVSARPAVERFARAMGPADALVTRSIITTPPR